MHEYPTYIYQKHIKSIYRAQHTGQKIQSKRASINKALLFTVAHKFCLCLCVCGCMGTFDIHYILYTASQSVSHNQILDFRGRKNLAKNPSFNLQSPWFLGGNSASAHYAVSFQLIPLIALFSPIPFILNLFPL